MKSVLIGIGLATLAFALPAQSAKPTPTKEAIEKSMKDCFEKHGGVMPKPAVKNERDCWRVHGHPQSM